MSCQIMNNALLKLVQMTKYVTCVDTVSRNCELDVRCQVLMPPPSSCCFQQILFQHNLEL